MTSIFKIMKAVFSNRNVLVISITSMIAFGIFSSLWRMWWSLYLIEGLGATVQQIGIIGMVQTSSSLLFQLPGGILADRVGRRRVIGLGTSFRLVMPICALLAKSWVWVLPGVIADSAASVYSPGFNALIAESLPFEQRATGFGVYRMMTSIPGIFMPIISGIYMDHLGVISGVRLGLTFSLFAFSGAFLARMIFLKETLIREPGVRSRIKSTEEQQRIVQTLKESLSNLRQHLKGTVLAMLVVSSVGGFAMRMVFSFLVIYGVEVIGLSTTQWGLLQSIASIFGTSLFVFGGMIADKYSRIPLITFARLLLPIRQLGLLFLRDYNQLLVLYAFIGIGGGLGGGGVRGGGFMGGPAWQSLVADVVPSRDRAKVMGLMATLTGLSGLIAPPLGAYVWETYSPDAVMMLSIIVGLTVVPIILLFFREPEIRER